MRDEDISIVLSERTLRCLEAAGWWPARTVDTAPYVATLTAENSFVGTAAIDFLSSFGGLTIQYPAHRVPTRTDECDFLVQRAAAGIDPGWVAEYEGVLRNRLTVIGQAFFQHFTVMMAEDGAVFGGFDSILYRLGDSGIDALNRLCEGREPELIEYTPDEPAAPESVFLNEEALKCLRAAGWRGPSVSDFVRFEGMGGDRKPTPRKADEFLQQFHGVRITCAPWTDPKTPGGKKESETCRFTSEPARHIPESHFAEYQQLVGQQLVAIGEVERADFVLLMSDDGRVFAGMHEVPLLWLVGGSAYDAINNLVSGASRSRVT